LNNANKEVDFPKILLSDSMGYDEL